MNSSEITGSNSGIQTIYKDISDINTVDINVDIGSLKEN